MIMPYAGAIANQAAAPAGWLLCDGSEQDGSIYVALKALLLTTYGAYTNGSGGTGTTHFRLPDLRGRVIAALDNMGGGSSDRITSPEGDQLGNVLGAQEHTLTAAQSGMPTHGHADNIATSNTLGINVGNLTADSVVNSLTIYGWYGGGGGEGSYSMAGLMYGSQSSQGNPGTAAATTSSQGGTHTGSVSTTIGGSASITGSVSITGGVTDANGANASAAHPLLQPTMFMNYIIKT